MIDVAKPHLDAVALLIHYSFDLDSYTASELIERWTHDYSATWIRSAVIEALYQGRYKSISVEQILAFWQRRQLALHHFNHEFERLICDNLPQTLAGQLETTANATGSEPNQTIFSNGHAPAITASGASEGMAVKVEPTANVPPVSTKAKESTYYRHQSNEPEKACRRIASQSPSSGASHSSIEHFTPADDSGEFYAKLRAIAQRPEAEQN